MKLQLKIIGKSIEDIETALNEFMKEFNSRELDSNVWWPLDINTEINYIFTDGNNVFENVEEELVIEPFNL